MRIGLMIPEFPAQTHIAIWRVGRAMRQLGAEVKILSTREVDGGDSAHPALADEAKHCHYVAPPGLLTPLYELLKRPLRTLSCLKYVLSMREGGLRQKTRGIGFLLCAANLVRYARKHRLECLFVHPCANAAHVVALAHLLSDLPYGVRVGGDLEVYGGDHDLKMQRARFVLAAAKPNAEQVIREVGIDANRVHVSWLGVSTQEFCPTPARQPQKNRLHIVTVARLNRAKGHRYALEAVREILEKNIDVRYTLIGSGPEESHIRETIKQYGLDKHVEVRGALGESEVRETLQSADVFILPSVGLGEAAPVAVIEAMSCGLPVIATVIGGTPDMIDNEIDGFLVPKHDSHAIAARLLRLAEDLNLRHRIGEAARARAIAQYDCKKVGELILSQFYPSLDVAPVPEDIPGNHKIGYLVPQFPEPTHTFFWREHQRLARRGIACDFVSTHLPVWPYRARHEWVNYAISQTTYLHDRGLISWMKDFWDLACTDPRRLARCLDTFGLADVPRPSEHLRLVAALLLGAKLRRIAKQRGWKHIHAHSCANTLNVAMFCNLLGGPTYSMTLHGPLADYGSNQAQKWLHASFAIVITERLREAVVKQLPVKCQPLIHVAGMGVEPSKFVRSTPYTPPSRTNAISLFTCSRLNPAKRIQDLIRATALSRQRGLDLQLKIAGEDENNSMGTRRLLEKEIERLDLTQHVRLLGSIAESEVREQLEQCHLFALVSLEEPLGVATMEAMAMQVPVIITGTGGAVELVHHKVHGLHVEPRHPEQIADAIEWFVNHPDEAYTMGQRCRQRVEALYHSGVSAEVISSEVRRLYPQTEKA